MKIQKDKLKHLVAGFVISGLIAILVANTCALFFPSWMAGFLGSMAAGGTKEYADKAWGGAPDYLDFGFTILGGALGGLLGLVALLI